MKALNVSTSRRRMIDGSTGQHEEVAVEPLTGITRRCRQQIKEGDGGDQPQHSIEVEIC